MAGAKNLYAGWSRAVASWVFVMMAVAVALAAASAETAKPSMKICFFELLPLSFTEGHRSHGLSVEVMREAGKRAGFSAEFRSLPWERCLAEVKAGRSDGTVDAVAREGYIATEFRPTHFILGVAVPSDSPMQKFTGLSSLDGLTGLFLRGGILPKELMEYQGFNRVEIGSARAGLKMVQFGRGDFVFVDFFTFQYLQKQMGTKLKMLRPSLGTLPTGPIFNIDRTDMATGINTALEGMRRDGSLDKIYLKWLGVTWHEMMEIGQSKPAG